MSSVNNKHALYQPPKFVIFYSYQFLPDNSNSNCHLVVHIYLLWCSLTYVSEYYYFKKSSFIILVLYFYGSILRM